MSSESRGLVPWLLRFVAACTAIIVFITQLVDLAQKVQGEARSVTLIALFLGIVLPFIVCLYYAIVWQPQAQGVRQYKLVKFLAWFGVGLVPTLMIAGYFGWQHVQSLPSKEVVILVAEFDAPEGQNYRVTETILGRLRDATEKYPDVQVNALKEPVTEHMGSDAARELGEKRKASIVIWGWYDKTATNVPVSVNFEVLQPPEYLPEFGDTASGAVQIFPSSEIDSVQLQTRLSSEMAYLTLFTLGMARYAAEDWDGAIALFNDALEQPKSPVASLDVSNTHYFKGNAYSHKEDYENAITAYDAALAIEPDYINALYNQGLALLSLKRDDEAIAAYDAALAIKPDDPNALYKKGDALGYLKRYEEAIAAFDAALAIKPNYPYALYKKGLALSYLERYDKAIAAYDAALALKPDDPDTLHKIGNALRGLESYKKAIAAFDAALAIKPDDPNALYYKGDALLGLKRYRKAIAAYDAALALKPDFYSALYNKGFALGNLKRREEAIAAFDAALALKPDAPNALSSKGVLLSNLKRYEEAIAAFDDALALNSDYPHALYNKARVYALQGKVDPALENLDKAIQLNPEEYREQAKSDTDFKSIRDTPRFKALVNSK